MKRATLLTSLVAVTLSACATTNGAVPDNSMEQLACFSVNSVTAFNYVDDSTVRIRTLDDSLFEIHLQGVCPQLRSAVDMALISRSGTSICAGESNPGSIQTSTASCDISEASVFIPEYIRQR